jgi:glyoxylase-like metal-dependent hydrolase (beta-lactamase superfamily II)
MRTTIIVLVMLYAILPLSGQGISPALRAVEGAAEALGGKQRILGIKTIKIEGYGQIAYQNGGGNISSSPDAPQKWVNVPEYEKVIDLENRRMRVRQRQHNHFVFASIDGYLGRNVTVAALDGDVAFNVGADGRAVRAGAAVAKARRIDMLAHPVTLVRAALEPNARLNNLRKQGNLDLVDVVNLGGDTMTMAIDGTSKLPAWISWVAGNENLGDVVFRTHFTGYLPVKGVMLPSGFNTMIDFRNVSQNKLYVDSNSVDVEIPNLAAPAEVRSAPAPPPAPVVEASQVAKGIWLLSGRGGANSVLFEFMDHLTLFELPTSQAWARALIDKAQSVVAGKKVTEVIVSHHHFDHTGGLRQAIASGLTIIAHKGNEGLFREIAARKSSVEPDSIGSAPRPLKFRAVDDRLQLKDAVMTLDVYHTVSNSHMAEGVFAYVPQDRLLIQGDFFDAAWEIYWWQDTYMDNVRHRNLQVDRDVPVHGRVLPFADVMDGIRRQTKAAQDLCAKAATAQFFPPGCPVKMPGK